LPAFTPVSNVWWNGDAEETIAMRQEGEHMPDREGSGKGQ